ncbi:MAG: GNAT family acetyltransferase [Firmicutes bacterium HGW-Firmicutes-2]|jgi:predicted acetyltransferase|nr:MAG: GNAT family acetyltransferase [Firmicutes bacterium HGW-Firmicutes-2]PKP47808.1 MAG: GNAT family acetyltransferase [Bacteroidetes bacterium HGW-Bacteroidetes-1]
MDWREYMENYRLIEPCGSFEKEFERMANDFKEHGELDYPKYYYGNFDEFLNEIKILKSGINLPEGYVATVTYWMVNSNNEILGSIRYREKLNEDTKINGGHIGYDISPSKRKLGYGKIMLKLLLEKLKEEKVSNILLTVVQDNLASIKIIESNGGVLRDTVFSSSSKEYMKRYWICL